MNMGLDRKNVERIITDLYYSTGAEYFFGKPLIGAASAGDELFRRYKSIIGDFHWTPDEALAQEYPQKAGSVIVWILPVHESARRTNRAMKDRPSLEWAWVRSFGELCNEQMRLQAAKVLTAFGYPAVAPQLAQCKKGYDFRKLGYASLWSERHAAFAAGLGTFGLSAGLITEVGVAIRIGSIVSTLVLAPDARAYGEDPYAWCSRCGECVKRCPVNAVFSDPALRDKKRCYEHLSGPMNKNRHEDYGWLDVELGCGMCQTGVACEAGRP
jgi:epoxyqueuosine reductase QueG